MIVIVIVGKRDEADDEVLHITSSGITLGPILLKEIDCNGCTVYDIWDSRLLVLEITEIPPRVSVGV